MKGGVKGEMSVGEQFARGAASQLYMVLNRLTRDCMATDFNEHWESFSSDFGKASRLQLRGPKEEDLGGYCRLMVEKIIDLHLTRRHKEERNVKS